MAYNSFNESQTWNDTYRKLVAKKNQAAYRSRTKNTINQVI